MAEAVHPSSHAPGRWWARPLFGVTCFGLTWPLVAVIDWATGDRPAPTAGLLAGKALLGVVQGLVYGFGGNWLVARGRPPAGTGPDAEPGAVADAVLKAGPRR